MHETQMTLSLMTQSMTQMHHHAVERRRRMPMVMTMNCSFLDQPAKTNGNQDAEPGVLLL